MLCGLDKDGKSGEMLAEIHWRKLPIHVSADQLPHIKFPTETPQACATWISRNWTFPFLTSLLASHQLPSWDTWPGCPISLIHVWPLLCLGAGGAKVAVRVRTARGQERDSTCLGFSSRPPVVQLMSLPSYNPADLEYPPLWLPLILASSLSPRLWGWDNVDRATVPTGDYEARGLHSLSSGLGARAALAIYNKLIFPSVVWRGTKLPWPKLSLHKQTTPQKALEWKGHGDYTFGIKNLDTGSDKNGLIYSVNGAVSAYSMKVICSNPHRTPLSIHPSHWALSFR